MKDESVRIYIERLRDGVEVAIDEMIEPMLLELSDDEIAFEKKIACTGKAYLADSHLVVCLDVATEANQPCSVCNEAVKTPIHLKKFYITKPLDEVRSNVFHYGDELREAILIEAPQFSECNEGNCNERESLQTFLKKEKNDDDEEVHFPFKDL